MNRKAYCQRQTHQKPNCNPLPPHFPHPQLLTKKEEPTHPRIKPQVRKQQPRALIHAYKLRRRRPQLFRPTSPDSFEIPDQFQNRSNGFFRRRRLEESGEAIGAAGSEFGVCDGGREGSARGVQGNLDGRGAVAAVGNCVRFWRDLEGLQGKGEIG